MLVTDAAIHQQTLEVIYSSYIVQQIRLVVFFFILISMYVDYLRDLIIDFVL